MPVRIPADAPRALVPSRPGEPVATSGPAPFVSLLAQRAAAGLTYRRRRSGHHLSTRHTPTPADTPRPLSETA